MPGSPTKPPKKCWEAANQKAATSRADFLEATNQSVAAQKLRKPDCAIVAANQM